MIHDAQRTDFQCTLINTEALPHTKEYKTQQNWEIEK